MGKAPTPDIARSGVGAFCWGSLSAFGVIQQLSRHRRDLRIAAGQTCVRDVEDNDDWSRDMQTYQKFGIATLASNWMCVYQNTDLKIETRPE